MTFTVTIGFMALPLTLALILTALPFFTKECAIVASVTWPAAVVALLWTIREVILL